MDAEQLAGTKPYDIGATDCELVEAESELEAETYFYDSMVERLREAFIDYMDCEVEVTPDSGDIVVTIGGNEIERYIVTGVKEVE